MLGRTIKSLTDILQVTETELEDVQVASQHRRCHVLWVVRSCFRECSVAVPLF